MIEIVLLIAGIILLVIGSYITVEGSVQFAKSFGISKTIIGLSIISIGTSLPEIATNIKSGLVGAGGVAIGTLPGLLVDAGLAALDVANYYQKQGYKDLEWIKDARKGLSEASEKKPVAA